MELERALMLASEIVKLLMPHCERVQVAGSIRRQRSAVTDIDLVLTPEDRWGLDSAVMRLGKVKMSGLKVARVTMDDGVQVDIYYATPETFAVLLLIRTGSKENNIRLCALAKKRGWYLAASGDGLFNEHGERIAGDSERSIYDALGIPYQEPWERG